MVTHTSLAPVLVRAGHVSLILGLTLGLAGCGHRRVAMRPAFAAPITTAAPVTVVPEPACPTGSIMTTTPASTESFLSSSSSNPTVTTPGTDAIQAGGGSPPAADVRPEEPILNIPEVTPVKPSSFQSKRPTGSIRRSNLGRQASTSGRSARVSLRDQVKPFVDNPEDLFAPPKADRPWKYVVLHHSASTEGGYDQIDRDHRKLLGFEGCGYHFVIGNGTGSPDGQIEVSDRWLNQKNGVHCRNGKTPDVNEYGIGICLVGNFDQTEPTARQVAAARALVAYLGDRYAIPSNHLGTHDQFATGETACPGKNFPTDAILGSAPLARR